MGPVIPLGIDARASFTLHRYFQKKIKVTGEAAFSLHAHQRIRIACSPFAAVSVALKISANVERDSVRRMLVSSVTEKRH